MTTSIIYANPGDHGFGTWSEEKSEGDKKYYSEDLIAEIKKRITYHRTNTHLPAMERVGYTEALRIIEEALKDE